MLGGCATVSGPGQATERVFDAPYDAVWRAALEAVGEVPLHRADVGQGLIETSWHEGYGERTQGLFLGGGTYRRRARYVIRIRREGSSAARVLVHPVVEERAPGGSRALRWERIQPSGQEVAWLVGAIAERLAGPGSKVPDP